MEKVYCTLFDKHYLDKGLVMIRSLREYNRSSAIYVLCMDEFCFDVISDQSFEKVVCISLNDFMDDTFRVLKQQRSIGEFCWTCTSRLVKYIFDVFKPDYCTYIDCDLLFFADPDELVDEMIGKHKEVQVIPHRFPNSRFWKNVERQSGKNCVQFNTFSSGEKSIRLLEKWIEQCIGECSVNSCGDQKYTSDWGKYDFVYESVNEGAGLAPWNLINYRLDNDLELYVLNRSNNKRFKMYFYHFQGIEYESRYKADIMLRHRIEFYDDKLVRHLYIPYLIKIEKAKDLLEKEYGFCPVYSHGTRLLSKDSNMNMSSRIRRFAKMINHYPYRIKDVIDIRKYI